MYAQMDTPKAVPKSEANMYWLVFLAVMSEGGDRGVGGVEGGPQEGWKDDERWAAARDAKMNWLVFLTVMS